MPVYDKPLIHYPLGTLMLAGVRDILIITTPEDSESFRRLLGDGTSLGIRLSYTTQSKPEGLAQAFIIAEDFIGDENVCLILGDNIFHGVGLGRQLERFETLEGAHIFAYEVSNPSSYGVVQFDSTGVAISLEEKPIVPKSRYAVPGIYFYDSSVVTYAKQLRPSARNELEITDLNRVYLEKNLLSVSILDRGTAWMDTGTIESLQDAANYVQIIENRQGNKVSCLEEIAWRRNWISDTDLRDLAKAFPNNSYGNYLSQLCS